MSKMIYVGRPICENGRYIIPFKLPQKLYPYFREHSFWFECPDAGEVPGSIAAVPAVANLIPFAWVFDCVLQIETLDRSFYEAIPKIKQGYIDMLPRLSLGGKLKVGNLVDNNIEACGRPLLLFSGGVDAWCTLVRHVDERPCLVSVWGADIRSDNAEGWNQVDSHSRTVADSLGITYSYVRSNLREMIDYQSLEMSSELVSAQYKWWHDLQHGIGLLSLTAPLAYATGAPRTYIASTFFEGDKGKYTCASDPTIDNMFAAGPMDGCHDGYELTRQDKIETIVSYAQRRGERIEPRVCFHVQSGRNCCRCEKCGRTILGIYAAGADPHDFGFRYSPTELSLLSFRMRRFYRMKIAHYRYIQQDALGHRDNIPPCFSWLFRNNLEKICDNDFKLAWSRFHRLGSDIYHKLLGR